MRCPVLHEAMVQGRIDDLNAGWKGRGHLLDLCGPHDLGHRGPQRAEEQGSEVSALLSS
jgi:hypothetical protein